MFDDGQEYDVIHGNKVVAKIIQCLGVTNIGLARLEPHISFNQQLLDIQSTPRILLSFREISMRDIFVIDSFVTGPPNAHVIRQKKETRNPRGTTIPHADVVLTQGVFATNTPGIKLMPAIRDGVCGSAIVRWETCEGEDILAEGQVGGFMAWSDVQSPYRFEKQVLCYCDAADALIDERWQIADMNPDISEEAMPAPER